MVPLGIVTFPRPGSPGENAARLARNGALAVERAGVVAFVPARARLLLEGRARGFVGELLFRLRLDGTFVDTTIQREPTFGGELLIFPPSVSGPDGRLELVAVTQFPARAAIL